MFLQKHLDAIRPSSNKNSHVSAIPYLRFQREIEISGVSERSVTAMLMVKEGLSCHATAQRDDGVRRDELLGEAEIIGVEEEHRLRWSTVAS